MTGTRPMPTYGEPITPTETLVLTLAAAGRTNRQIGHSLFVTEDTVKTHLRRIAHKLGTHDRASAVVTAMRTGQLPCACTKETS